MDIDSEAWIAAVGAPWAMAPHPNFSQDLVTGPSLLALVAQFRLEDVERYEKVLAAEEPSWVLDLVHSAKDSLQHGTIRSGAAALWDIAGKVDVPASARVAAALFASVAEVDLDELPVAVSSLHVLQDELTNNSWPNVSPLALGLLNLQIASRQFELFDYGSAMQTLENVQKYSFEPAQSGPFPVSLGIGWDSHTVLHDIQEAISAHALELRARMEGFQGTSWVDVVKSRASWPDHRGGLPAATRDRKFVEHWFDEAVGASRGRRTIYQEDPIIKPALESLLVAELTGNVNRFMRERAALAQVRILQHEGAGAGDGLWDVQEALRLFRRSRSRENLKNTLQLIYLQGPDAALLGDAQLILKRSSFPTDVTSADLAVMSFAAPFLSPDDLGRAMDAALGFILAPMSTPGSQTMDERGAWSAIAKLLPGSGKDRQVAQAALEAARNGRIALELIENDLLRLLENLEWNVVDPETVTAWREWGEQRLASEVTSDLGRLAGSIGKPIDYASRLRGIPPSNLAEYLVRHFDDLGEVPEETLQTAEDSCITAIQQIREEALRGTLTLKSVDTGEISLVFAKLFSRPRVWVAVAELLTDRNVARELKERSLQRIAEYGPVVVPEEAQQRLRSKWAGVIESELQDIFFSEGDDTNQFAQAYRAGTALGILSRDETISIGTELSCSKNPADRLSACDLLPEAGAAFEEWEWSQLLLLQLAQDRDALVRSRAARSLASICTIKTGVSSLVENAVVKALQSDGIHVPLMTLHGLQKITHSGKTLDGNEVVAAVRGLKNNHRARVIRKAAEHALNPQHLGDN